MPKVVDHAERRRELARAALRVIGRDGLDAATTRSVAAESGWSTGLLKHYFENKDELLREALRELERSTVERFGSATEATTGLEAIRAVFAGMLATESDDTKVWIAYMSRASVDPRTGRAMQRSIELWVGRWSELLVRGQTDGSIRREIDPEQTALELHALLSGLRTDTAFAPSRFAPGELTLLDALAADASG